MIVSCIGIMILFEVGERSDIVLWSLTVDGLYGRWREVACICRTNIALEVDFRQGIKVGSVFTSVKTIK